MTHKSLSLTFVLLLWGANVFSQKQPMKIDDCKLWRAADKIALSADGKWAAFNYRYLYKEVPDTAYLYNVRTGKIIVKPGMKDFDFIAGGKVLKYSRENKDDSLSNGRPALYTLNLSSMREKKWNPGMFMVPIGQSDNAYYVSYKPSGKTDFTLTNLLTGKEQKIEGINCYTVVDANTVLYTVSDSVKSVLYLYKNGQSKKISDVPAIVSTIGQPDNKGLVMLSCAADFQNRYDVSSLYRCDINTGNCSKLLDYADIKGLPTGVKLSSSSKFINNGTQLAIDLEPSSYSQPAADDKPKANVELWIWNENLSPRRQARQGGFKVSNYDKYIYNLSDKSLTALPTKGISFLSFPSSDSIYGFIGTDETPWYTESDWTMHPNTDIYYIGMNGVKKKIATHGQFELEWSPDGAYALLFVPSSKSWVLVDAKNGQTTDISKGKVPYPMYNEDHDYSFDPSPYGVAYWNMNERTVIVYDRYDMWALDLDNHKASVCITGGYGRANSVQLRMPDKYFSTKSTTYLYGIDAKSKSKGLYALTGSQVQKVAVNPKFNLTIENFSSDKKVFIWNKENFGERDLWVSDIHFAHPRRLTDCNPQVKHISWGTSQLYTWTNYEGKKNEGILFLPENYKKGDKCPMVVTYYELETQGLNSYRMPEYSSAVIDIPTFVSNGYIVFAPDVHFRIGAPGQSCYDAIVSGVEQLIKDGIADKDRIGAQGHSWGGFETAYLVTRTNIFKCASPCSAVTDMVADYLMLRGTGQPNMYFEEDAQGRLGKTLWQDRQMYIDNSAVYNADKIHTPLLIFHGEKDTSVQPYQGMALYFALRRLGRPAWLLNYRDEGHQMGGTENCRDFSQRLSDFFGYYLKGQPMPEWMKPTADNMQIQEH